MLICTYTQQFTASKWHPLDFELLAQSIISIKTVQSE